MMAAFWALPNDPHAVLQKALLPTAELIPLKFGILPSAPSIHLYVQVTSAPASSHPPQVNKDIWPPDQLRPLLKCLVLPVCSVELLHQIGEEVEPSWATAPPSSSRKPVSKTQPPHPPPSPLPALRSTSPRGSRPVAQSARVCMSSNHPNVSSVNQQKRHPSSEP